jgi:hypothetical protein
VTGGMLMVVTVTSSLLDYPLLLTAIYVCVYDV